MDGMFMDKMMKMIEKADRMTIDTASMILHDIAKELEKKIGLEHD
jgi:hypothetical protein